ncbi:snRNA-activating protein complex subunit 4 [Pelodytes ibericus]
MAALDIDAEREKIQREIEALEKSLGSAVQEIDVAVSDSSLESDDDNLDSEDNSDGELQKEVADWEDGCNKTEMCLQMNLVFQTVIEEKIQEVEILIAQNREQQDEILWEIAGRKIHKAGDSKLYPLNLAVGHFQKPYFKDKTTGVGPPANQDMVDRALQGIKSFQELINRKWKSQDSKELRTAIISDRLQKMLQPKLLKMEYLQTKLDGADNDINRKILTKQMNETDREIEDINQLSEDVLVGKRTDEHDWDKISNINFEGVHSAEKLRKLWQNLEHPHISKKEWGEEEMAKLQELAAKHNYTNWQEIAQELGTNRTAFQCLQKYQHNNKEFKRKEFTKEEDEMLTHLVQQMRVGDHIPYQKISYFMEGRDGLQLLNRWSKCLNPSLKKGFWTPSEDELLLKAVAKYGEKDWYKIQNEVPRRSDVQCRERYMKGLHTDLKKGKWSSDEKQMLMKLVEKHGVGHWSKVSSEIPHRSGSQCLSKWKAIMGYFKRSGKPLKQRKKKVAIELASTTSSSGSSSSSEESEMEEDTSEEEEEEEEEEEKLANEEQEMVTEPIFYIMPGLDLWVPKRQYPEAHGKSLGKDSACFRSKRIKTVKEGSFQFTTILKGIAYPYSTDSTIEDPEQFLKEAVESGREILKISEADVRKVLKRNTNIRHDKQVLRVGLKQAKPSAEPCSDQQTEDTREKPVTGPQRRLDLYKDNVDRKLLLAVTPWVGNVFLPLSTGFGRAGKKNTHADAIKKKLCSVTVTSTPIFTFFIQFFQIDANGCLQMIRKRKANPPGTVLKKMPPKAPPIAGQGELTRSQSLPASGPGVATHQQKSPVPKGLTPSGKKNSAGQRGYAPSPKPKTVYELLKEKRLRESKMRGSKAPTDRPALVQNLIIPQSIVIQPQANMSSSPQTVVLPLNTSQVQKGLWPVMPFVPVSLQHPLPITLMPTVMGSASANNTGVPMTWIVTPQGLIPLPLQALGFGNLNQQAPAQEPVRATTAPGSTSGTDTQNVAGPIPRNSNASKTNNANGPPLLTSASSNSTGNEDPSASQQSSLSAAGCTSTRIDSDDLVPPESKAKLSSSTSSTDGYKSSTLPVLNPSACLDAQIPAVTISSLPKSATANSSGASVVPSPQLATSLLSTLTSCSGPSSNNLNLQPVPVLSPSLCLSKDCSDAQVPAATISSHPKSTMANSSGTTLVPSPQLATPLLSTMISSSGPSANNLNITPIKKTGLPTLAPKVYSMFEKIPPVTSAKSAVLSKSDSPRAGLLTPPRRTPQSPLNSPEKNVLDLSLVSLEEEARVKEWIQGGAGVEIPNLKSKMSFLPPSVCTLKTLSRLLLQKSALEKNAFKLLPQGKSEGKSSSNQQMEMVNELVNQKLKDNPAYLLLKQRFLSAFTFSALLAILPPGRTRTSLGFNQLKCESSDDMGDSTDTEINENRVDDMDGNIQKNLSEAINSEAPLHDEVLEKEVAQDEQSTSQGAPDISTATTDSAPRRMTRNRASCPFQRAGEEKDGFREVRRCRMPTVHKEQKYNQNKSFI